MRRIVLLALVLLGCADDPAAPELPWCSVSFGVYIVEPGARPELPSWAKRAECEGPFGIVNTETGEHLDLFTCSWCAED